MTGPKRSLRKAVTLKKCATKIEARHANLVLKTTGAMGVHAHTFHGAIKKREKNRQWHICHFPLIRKSDSKG